MDPSAGNVVATTSSPGGSRVSLPSLVAQVSSSGGGDNIFSALAPPPLMERDTSGKNDEKKREVFSDFRRFVSFAVRRERGEKAE